MKSTAKPGLPAGWQAGLGQGLKTMKIESFKKRRRHEREKLKLP